MTGDRFLLLAWLVILTSILVDLHSGFKMPWSWSLGCFVIVLALVLLAVLSG